MYDSGRDEDTSGETRLGENSKVGLDMVKHFVAEESRKRLREDAPRKRRTGSRRVGLRLS